MSIQPPASIGPLRIFKAAACYCGLVLGSGFVLGMIRVPLLVPRLGERTAELQEQSIRAYFAGRDPVSGSVYLGMLLLFALMPLLLARK